MNHLLLSLSLLITLITYPAAAHQNEPRYAPGVPPAHQHQQQQYQQPPQYQQQQQQYQQPPQQQQQQYQQPPQQQHQQVNQMNQQQPPAPQQGVHPPVGGGHHHDDSLRFSSDVHNAEHVMEHLENVIETKPKEQMTEEELEFHYFKMHDYDDNNKLDGVEIGKALTHYHADDNTKRPVMSDDDISRTVDAILSEDDLNNDGYVEYVEFVTAQRRATHQTGLENSSSLSQTTEEDQQQQDQGQQQDQQQDQGQQQDQQQDQGQQQDQQQDQGLGGQETVPVDQKEDIPQA